MKLTASKVILTTLFAISLTHTNPQNQYTISTSDTVPEFLPTVPRKKIWSSK